MVKIGQKVSLKRELNTAQGVRVYTVIDILSTGGIVLEGEDGIMLWATENSVEETNRKEEGKR